MSAPTHAPAPPAAAPGQRPPEIDLETRLALTDASMTLRLEQALTRLAVDTGHTESAPGEGVFSPEAVAVYAATVRPAPDLYPTPVAALLQRAAGRLESGGWCRGATVNEAGARCLYGAIHAEARGAAGLEAAGLDVLLAVIRREYDPAAESVPGFNDHRLGGERIAVRLLESAASLADARGL